MREIVAKFSDYIQKQRVQEIAKVKKKNHYFCRKKIH